MTPNASLSEGSETVVDPVCGMKIRPKKAAGTQEHEGQTYSFCNPACLSKFQADPDRFVHGAAPAPPATGPYTCPMHPEVHENKVGPCPKCGMSLEREGVPQAAGTDWTCPMHPQISRAEPDSCPICGMALELRNLPSDEANPELASMSRRLWIGVALTLPLIAFMISDVLPGQPLKHWIGG